MWILFIHHDVRDILLHKKVKVKRLLKEPVVRKIKDFARLFPGSLQDAHMLLPSLPSHVEYVVKILPVSKMVYTLIPVISATFLYSSFWPLFILMQLSRQRAKFKPGLWQLKKAPFIWILPPLTFFLLMTPRKRANSYFEMLEETRRVDNIIVIR